MPKRKSVLVVDPHRDDRTALVQMLAGRHLRVSEADTIDSAIMMLHEHSLPGAKPFSAMFVNLMFPEGTGVDLVSEIRSRPRLAQLPVIMTYEAANDVVKASFYPLGLVGHAVKPLSLSLVMGLLQEAFRM